MACSSFRLSLLCLIVASFAIQAMANSHESESDSVDLADHKKEADSPEVSSESDGEKHSEEVEAMAPSSRKMGQHKTDKSMAGGGVIIGGLATAIFAAVFCYIRVTRKRNTEI